MEIEFLQEHKINIVYNPGDTAKVFEELAQKLIDDGIAKKVIKQENKTKKGE